MLFSHSVMSDSLWPHTAASQASLSITISQNLLKLIFIESVIPHNHLILCHPLLPLPSIFPESGSFPMSWLFIRWAKYWSFSFSISPPIEYSGLIYFKIDWFGLAVQGTLKSLLQHHHSKVSILWHSALFVVKLSHPHKTICGFNLANNGHFLHCAFPHIYILWLNHTKTHFVLSIFHIRFLYYVSENEELTCFAFIPSKVPKI